MRVLGPNTSGLLSMPQNLARQFFPPGEGPPREHFLHRSNRELRQPTACASSCQRKTTGVARVVGLGNKVDVDESDALEYLGEDPETNAIIVYLESFKRPQRVSWKWLEK